MSVAATLGLDSVLQTAQTRWNELLEAATTRLFPEYSSRVIPLKENKQATAILSSLPFQMLMYFNIFLYPVWLTGAWLVFTWKMAWFQLSYWHLYQTLFLMLAFSIMEPVRLWLGYNGNLRERVPEISGCFVFSCFPQLLVLVYLLVGQPFTSRGFSLPIETALNFVYMCLVVPEIVFGYLAARAIVKQRTIEFFLHFDQDADGRLADRRLCERDGTRRRPSAAAAAAAASGGVFAQKVPLK
ncbi:hypothetical protein BC831DRAFT_426367 [Entophlyctis helioformis]|nr:hypothetical protein BC831DRAFT_426367 [Entophlyctis helioformis]